MIRLYNIFKIFDQNQTNEKIALADISLEIDKGELVAIVGKSGSGKSTLLNIIGCMDSYTSGVYEFLDNNIENFKGKALAEFRNKQIGFVTQKPFLIEEFSAIDNVLLPLKLKFSKRKEGVDLAQKLLSDVGLGEIIFQEVNTMSGGEKQRVSIARALVNEPELLIADEPTGALDTANAEVIINILKKINKSGKTVIVVTHDMDIAKQCNRIITLSDGKIVGDEAKQS